MWIKSAKALLGHKKGVFNFYKKEVIEKVYGLIN